jgi:hypothetical protein
MKITCDEKTIQFIFIKKGCCYANKIILRKSKIIGLQTNHEDESIKIILEGAEPIWLYFADSSVGDETLEAATAKIISCISS